MGAGFCFDVNGCGLLLLTGAGFSFFFQLYG